LATSREGDPVNGNVWYPSNFYRPIDHALGIAQALDDSKGALPISW
jgi:hypothetical protein